MHNFVPNLASPILYLIPLAPSPLLLSSTPRCLTVWMGRLVTVTMHGLNDSTSCSTEWWSTKVGEP